MNRRGNIFDTPFFLVILFGLAVGIPILLFVADEIAVEINESGDFENETVQKIEGFRAVLPGAMNYGFALVFFIVFIAIALSAYYVKSTPLFAIIALVLLGIFGMIAADLSNAYGDYATSDADMYNYIDANLPLLDHVMNNIVTYIALMGLLIIVVLYAKIQGGPAT
jgi:hypothetical protein